MELDVILKIILQIISDLGDLYIWGWNETGQLGFTSKLTQTERQVAGDNSKQEDYVNILPEPRIIDLESCSEVTVTKVSCGSRHTAAVTGKFRLKTVYLS